MTNTVGCNYCGKSIPDAEPHVCSYIDNYPENIGDTCCGKCPGASCYVDYLTGERE